MQIIIRMDSKETTNALNMLSEADSAFHDAHKYSRYQIKASDAYKISYESENLGESTTTIDVESKLVLKLIKLTHTVIPMIKGIMHTLSNFSEDIRDTLATTTKTKKHSIKEAYQLSDKE